MDMVDFKLMLRLIRARLGSFFLTSCGCGARDLSTTSVGTSMMEGRI